MTAPIPDPLATWAASRSLTVETLKAFDVSLRKWRGRPALVYPTSLAIDRVRYIDDERPKYGWAKKGGRTHWYGLDNALHRNKFGPIYVVNGEISVWAAYQAGLSAVCTCGGENAIPSDIELARLIRLGRPLRIVYDNDESGQTGGRRLAYALYELGSEVQARNIGCWFIESAIGLGVAPEDRKGFDVDDLHQHVGDDLGEVLADLEVVPLDTPEKEGPVASSHWHLAEVVLRRLNGRGRPPMVFDEDRFWQYQPARGVYTELRVDAIAREIGELDGYVYGYSGDKPKTIRVTQSAISGVVKCASYQTAKPGYFGEAPTGLQFADGFFSWESLRLEASSPDLRQRIEVGVCYDSTAEAPMWDRALSDWFGTDDDGFAKRHLLQEFAGACLFGAAPELESVLFLVGPGGDGKSQCLNVLTGLMPSEAVCAVSPQSFSRYDAPYYLARLAGKLVNAVADIPPDEIVSTSELKAAVTGDQLEARRPRGEPFTFRPRAGHIFSANELPGTLDQTQGFWRRMIVIRFGRKFTGEPIRNLGARILENERPGLFAWALDGARRVRVQGRYTVPEVVLSEVQKWRHDSDQVSIFLVDETIANDEAQSWTSAGDVFERYRKWASSTGHGQMSKSKFGKRLKLLCASRRSKNGIEYAVTLRTRV